MRHGSRLLRLTRRAGRGGLREDPSRALPARGGRSAGWYEAAVRQRWNRSDRGQCPARGGRPARAAFLASFRRSGAGMPRANDSERPCACDMCVNRALSIGHIRRCACRIPMCDASRSTLIASWFTAAPLAKSGAHLRAQEICRGLAPDRESFKRSALLGRIGALSAIMRKLAEKTRGKSSKKSRKMAQNGAFSRGKSAISPCSEPSAADWNRLICQTLRLPSAAASRGV
jgi:hypothetical protein